MFISEEIYSGVLDWNYGATCINEWYEKYDGTIPLDLWIKTWMGV